MKITVEVDDEVLARVKARHQLKTYEDTVLFALRDVSQREYLKEFYSNPLMPTREELADISAPDDPHYAPWSRFTATATPNASHPHENAASDRQ